ncbi:type 1 glutamine amidotransferase domain-containing protein [Allorhodopirellula solitaria]
MLLQPCRITGDFNMSKTLDGKRIAFLATDGFEQVELTQPWDAIKNAGADVVLVSPESGTIQGMNHDEKADKFKVDENAGSVSAENFDGLVLPGGVANPDALRMCDDSVSFVRDFFKQHKPVAAICHGPWTLIEADVVRGRKVTSWPSLKTDLTNAGAEWVDQECVVDEGLVTSRKPDDLDAFCAKAIEEFAEGKHAQQTA